jgi:dipeptidyl aminopeptidase/acylaminoacyl peptidase
VIGGSDGSGLSISPDGRFVAFEMHQASLETNDYRVNWLIAPIGRKFTQTTDVGDAGDPTLFRSEVAGGPVNGSWLSDKPKWAPDSFWIVYRRKLEGDIQLWRSKRDGSVQQQLTYSPGNVEEFHWSSDGQRLYFATDASREELAAAKRRHDHRGYLFDYEKSWATHDGQPYREPYALTGGKPLIWMYDWHSGLERPATKTETAEYERLGKEKDILADRPLARSVLRSSDSERVGWLEIADLEKQGVRAPLTIYAADSLVGGERRRCIAPECTGQILTSEFHGGLAWDSAGREMLYFRKEGKAYSDTVLYVWNVESDSVRAILRTKDWISDCSRVAEWVVCFRQAPDYPRTIIAIDLSNGRVATLVDPNPKFGRLELGATEGISWEDSDGNATFGFLIKPRGYEAGTRYPLVIVGYHARHALYGGVGHESPVHQLAASGFAVLVYERPIDWEMHALESDPTALAIHDWGPNMYDYRTPLSLFESVIHKLRDDELIDEDRVGIAGFSNGANHVAYSLVNSDLFAAATMASSVYSPCIYFVGGVPGSLRRNLQFHTGSARQGTGRDWKWTHVSPALNADRVNTPLLIQSSDFEHIRALQDVIALTEARKPVEMHVFPNEYHVKWEPVHRLITYERSFDWFNFWLRDVEDPDSTKVEQYQRWRKLKRTWATGTH